VLKDQKLEFYRGDSFQANIKDPRIALELVLKIRAAAKSISTSLDVRASIGIGNIPSRVTDLRTSTSEAFVLSGRGFDELQSDSRLTITSNRNEANLALKVIALYCDFIFRGLTSKQAAVLFELLQRSTQVEIAKKLKKSQATINRHAQSASWADLEMIMDQYEKIITHFHLL
jgi:hypothetical protein